LSGKGAWAPGFTYNQSVVQEIVAYAQQRGIRVVPEFDMPGHAYSWGYGYPNLTAVCPNYEANIENIPVNPTINFTYQVISAFMSQYSQIFTDNNWHIGGDEVITSCWAEDPSIESWMSSHKMKPIQLLQYFENQLQPIVSQNNKIPVCWEDLFDNGIQVPSNTIIEVWSNKATLSKIVAQGYQGITAYGNYLNYQAPIQGVYVSQWENTWQTFYNNDPTAGLKLSPTELNLVLGGEGAMWAEQVNSVNFDSRVWPRACAIGERLWSPQTVNSYQAAQPRLVEQRCRIARRGIGAGPIIPDFCPLPSDDFTN
jgi:hexosaminidase